MYHRHAEPGSSAAYWEEFGSGSTLADHLRFCEVDPLRPLFARFLRPGSIMLEGGCGRGQYVAYYSGGGVKVVGLDFARAWLAAAHAEMPSLMFCVGDVSSLPFPDDTFDVYYSGGVVEHFEEGAGPALDEARRVLKRDGVLLLSVPYFSPLRRALSFVGRAEWRHVARASIDEGPNGHLRFHQYAYTIPEFTRLLSSAGFRVIDTQGYAVVWGLYDLEPIRRAATRFERRRARSEPRAAGTKAGPRVALHGAQTSRNGSLLKRLVVAEDATVPVAGWFVRMARSLCANMMMYVCTPTLSDVVQGVGCKA